MLSDAPNPVLSLVTGRGRPVLFVLVAAGCLACGGAQTDGGGTTPEGETPAVDGDGPETPEEEGGDGEVDGDDAGASSSAVCTAYESTEADPLRRWVNVHPVQRGGAVLVFIGPEAAQMEVEMSMEMAGIVGYEVDVCGTAVIVWVPGMECSGDDRALSDRVEEGTSMIRSDESYCFRIDETRLRLREECERGNITGGACP